MRVLLQPWEQGDHGGDGKTRMDSGWFLKVDPMVVNRKGMGKVGEFADPRFGA